MNIETYSVLFEYAHCYLKGTTLIDKTLVEIELDHGYINLFSLSLSQTDSEQYKIERLKAQKFLGNSFLLNYMHKIDISNDNIDIKIETFQSKLREIQRIKNDSLKPGYLEIFSKKINITVAYAIISSIAILAINFNGYTIFWYNYVIAIMSGYIFTETFYKHIDNQLQIYDDNLSNEKFIPEDITLELNNLAGTNFEYHHFEAMANTLESSEFKQWFTYTYLPINKTSTTNMVDVQLLNEANSTIRKANLRINVLKSTQQRMQQQNINLNAETARLKRIIAEQDNSNSSEANSCPYELLGVRKDERDIKVIKKNYIRLCNIYHSDRSGSDYTLKKINVAYKKLQKICNS